MELLINKNTVAQHLQTAIGYNESAFNTFIAEAQELDLKPLVCEEFYFDLLQNQNKPEYQTLLNGGNYNYQNRTYYFSGLGKVLSYFAYARFILKSNVVSTSHGFTIKKTPHSEPLSLEERKNFYYSYRKDANTLFDEVKKYLNRHQETFNSWKCENSCETKSINYNSRVIQ